MTYWLRFGLVVLCDGNSSPLLRRSNLLAGNMRMQASFLLFWCYCMSAQILKVQLQFLVATSHTKNSKTCVLKILKTDERQRSDEQFNIICSVKSATIELEIVKRYPLLYSIGQ